MAWQLSMIQKGSRPVCHSLRQAAFFSFCSLPLSPESFVPAFSSCLLPGCLRLFNVLYSYSGIACHLVEENILFTKRNK
jgi:hypothetical protein